MKNKYDTLTDIIQYVKKTSKHPIDTLLQMGLTPCQLVNEFHFDDKTVRQSPLFKTTEANLDEKLDEDEYPFVLDCFNPFDAALISRFQFTKEQLYFLKQTAIYQEILDKFQEEKMAATIECENTIFDKYTNAILETVS